ncbi:hypothetical protein C8034_v012256 [Colletotrichum sidae]|uniref:Uncharacterized protein n=1 Tax=Colletotrichum sidae TaxID=1347389 RepID=A0A4R8TGV0_9PEZI|nr:hypothetical protein C8034_v012256 [Colletotrichum sidae]
MNTFSIFSRKGLLVALVGTPSVLAAYHAWTVYSKIKRVDQHHSSDSISESFQQSRTLTELVNPRGHVSAADAWHTDLNLPASTRRVTDEALLAAFVRGFFGGTVLALERSALRLARLNLVSYKALELAHTPQRIWHKSELSSRRLPSLGSIIFGAFQISNVQLVEADGPEQTESYIDVVYGSSQGRFAGAHRFSIVRDPTRPGQIRISFESTACNPTDNLPFAPAWAYAFHHVYATLLFRESVAEVLRLLETDLQAAGLFVKDESGS